MRHKHVHLDFEIPEWIAELIIAKLDDESMREHFEASKLDVNEQAEGRERANVLASVKKRLENVLHAEPAVFRMKHTQNDQRGASNCSSAVSGGSQAIIQDRAGLYVAILATVLAAIALGILIMMPAMIDAKIQAGIARADATAHASEVNSRVALDKVEDFRAKLADKGINVVLDGH